MPGALDRPPNKLRDLCRRLHESISFLGPTPSRSKALPPWPTSTRKQKLGPPHRNLADTFFAEQWFEILRRKVSVTRWAGQSIGISIALGSNCGLVEPLADRAGQCCFLCYGQDKSYRAVQVPCIRPSSGRTVRARTLQPRTSRREGKGANRDGNATNATSRPIQEDRLMYAELAHHERAVECDADIYQRIKSTWLKARRSHQALSLLGCKLEAREVEVCLVLLFSSIVDPWPLQFFFTGYVDPNEHFPISLQPLRLDSMKKKLDDLISQEPDKYDREFGDVCLENSPHSSGCLALQALGYSCDLAEIANAKERRPKLDCPDLMSEYLRSPRCANGQGTLESGIAQESCIYEL